MDQNRNEDALATLDGALGCAHRLSANSDVVGEVLRRRADVLFRLGRLEEAERDCSEAIKLTREIGDKLEEGASLRVLASVCYAKGESTAAEVLITRAAEMLRRIGESMELARAAMAEGVGLRDSAAPGQLSLDRLEARFSAAEAIFTRVGASGWVARSQLERGKALQRGGQPDRARTWLERARLKLEVGGDRQGLAEVDAILRELDAGLADAAVSLQARYSTIAEGYRFLETAEPRAEDLHQFAEEITDVLVADRMILFALVEGAAPAIAISVDRSGRGIAEATRFVRTTLAARGSLRPLVVSDGRSSDGSAPKDIGAVALIPAQVGFRRDRSYVLYADRFVSEHSTPFTQSDIEFIGAAARMLGVAHSRLGESSAWEENGRLAEELGASPESAGFITKNSEMLRILASIERLKDSRVPIVISGESGVGKDIIARAIHQGGRSRTGKFVALNACAIAQHLQESELFGHVKGAFTDADRDREGLVQVADRGTLFLDEIGEMGPQLQVKLLRFLQNGEYRRVGENITRVSDARVISATNKDLSEEVKEGRFRRDLFYRLCAVVIEIPPLRDRSDDIPLLMEHFLKLYCEREEKPIPGFSREVRELFMKHDWRGNNVRELENDVRRGVALAAEGEVIGIDKVRPELRDQYQMGLRSDEALRRSLKEEVEALEKSRILEALGRTSWNKQAASELLGLSRPGLHAKMRKYGIG